MLEDITESISQELKNNALELLPEGTEILKVETSQVSEDMFFTVTKDGEETVVRVTRMSVLDRLRSCSGNIVVHTETEKLRAVYESIVAEEDHGHCLEPAFGEDPVSEEGTEGNTEEPNCSGEMLNVIIQETLADIRPIATAISVVGVKENFLVPNSGCCQLKTRLLIAGTVFALEQGEEPVVDGKLNPILARRMMGCINRENTHRSISEEDFLEAEVLGFKNDEISDYVEVDVLDLGKIRVRVHEIPPKD